MWVHEGFANYAEGLYTECLFGKQAGAEYIIGSRHNIRNDRPIIAAYGVNAQGSGDMYYKGGSLLHTIRQLVGSDKRWRSILRGLNRTFWHQTVTSADIERYLSKQAGADLSKIFDQYLRTSTVPLFEYRIEGKTLSYRWAEVVPGFAMPLRVTLSNSKFKTIHPTEGWQTRTLKLASPAEFRLDPNFYVVERRFPNP
jgi:aminopeptidase N